MNRPTAEESTAKAREGTEEPDRVLPIADNGNNPRKVGFMYEGDEYGEDAWIMCKQDDLETVEF